jgi:hypothetical protein
MTIPRCIKYVTIKLKSVWMMNGALPTFMLSHHLLGETDDNIKDTDYVNYLSKQ